MFSPAVRRRFAPLSFLLAASTFGAYLATAPSVAQLATFQHAGSLAPPLPPNTASLGSWAIGDIDGDGLVDIVGGAGASPFAGVVAPHYQRVTRPVFVAGPLHSPQVTPIALALVDASGDGRLDLVAANSPFAGFSAITVCNGVPGAGFGAPAQIAHQGNAKRLASADYDDDGLADLAVLEFAPPQLELLRRLPGGGFAPGVVTPLAAEFDALASGDFDGDGDDDLLVGAAGGAFLVASVGAGGGFTLGPTLLATGGAAGLAVGDLDSDGDDDAVVHGASSAFRSFLGGPTGLTGPGASIPVLGGVVKSLVLAHVDGDTKLDAAISTGTSGSLYTLFGHGNGEFTLPHFSGTRAAPLVALDFDADGRDELVTPGTQVSVLELDAAGNVEAHEWLFASPANSSQAPLAYVDVSGDGVRDIAWATPTGEVGIALGLAANGFALGRLYSMPGASPTSSQLVDLDGDALLDIVALATSSASPDKGTVYVRAGQPGGTFGPLVGHTTTPTALQSMRIGDVDGNGALDVVTLEPNVPTSRAWILRGDGAGGLLPAQVFDLLAVALPKVSSPAFSLADLDLDGRDDLAVVVKPFDEARLWIYSGQAGGSFAQPPLVIPHVLPAAPTEIAAVDLDADGRSEILLRQGDAQSSAQPTLLVLRASGPFAFHAPDSYGTGPASGLAIADYSGEGDLDVALLGSTSVRVLYGHGDARLYAQEVVLASSEPSASGLPVDFDSDGRIDLVTGGGTNMHAWLNRTPAKSGLYVFGTGLPGCGGAHALTGSSTPRAGNASFALEWQNAPSSVGGLALIGFGPQAPVPAGADLLGIGIPLHVDVLHPNGFIVLGAAGTAAGAGSLALPIPDVASLIGTSLYAQVAWPWTAGPCTPSLPLGLSASNGLAMTVQP